jgi:hypothetical protein
MVKSTPSIEFTSGGVAKRAHHSNLVHNIKILITTCHFVYATVGLIQVEESGPQTQAVMR